MFSGSNAVELAGLLERIIKLEKAVAALKTAERRKTVAAKPAVQQRKARNAATCSNCTRICKVQQRWKNKVCSEHPFYRGTSAIA
jgi:hypothetical protein